MAKALLNSAGQVITFLRDDLPEGYQPPAGCSLIDQSQLPAGWVFAPPNIDPSLSISPRQIREWLLSQGITDATVEAAITAQITDPTAQQIALIDYRTAEVFVRSDPLVAEIGAALGLTSAQIDAGFLAASQL